MDNTEEKPDNPEVEKSDQSASPQDPPHIDVDNLSDEELGAYKQKIIDAFKDVNINNPDELLKYLQSNYVSEIPHMDRPEKLTICPHEIVFSITASVMEENEKGETIGCKEICQKNYHIPVPPQNDYNIYMQSFFDHVSKCIQTSAQTAMKESEKKDNE